MKSEFEFISWLRGQIATKSDDLIAGVGDDAAIIHPAPDRELLISTDLLVEDIHFKLDYTPPTLLGNKALAVNLSDIAAMGGKSRYFLLSISRPKDLPDSTLEEIVSGMLTLAHERGVTLIGGDTCASKDRLFINITVIGDCARGKAIRRNGAQPGDLVYVTGSLGGAALGLEMLRAGQRLKDARQEIFSTSSLRDYLTETEPLRAQLAPQPRIALGGVIGERELATAMIDISDGLSSDIGHICEESNVGVELNATAIPVMAGATLTQALTGGEDYELLFTVSPAKVADIEQLQREYSATEIRQIGLITSARERWLIDGEKREPLLARGFDHFASE